jgi:hypothetical protein
MGLLGQPLNTFWQLFFRPAGAATWSDRVGATATATNGGLVLASAVGQPLLAAVRPSNLLRFSPLIATTDGHAWEDGLVPGGLDATPGALATAPGGRSLALVGGGAGARVLASAGDISRWTTLGTARGLAAAPAGRACGPSSLTAVALLAGLSSATEVPMVGAACSRPGVVGIFTIGAQTWRADAPVVPAALRRGRVTALSLRATEDGLTALLGVENGTSTVVVAAWTSGDGTKWTESPALVLSRGAHLDSFGPTDGTGSFVLSTDRGGVTSLATIDGPADGWGHLPPPPRQTATVAFDSTPAAATVALAPQGTTLTVWSLAPGGRDWTEARILHVALTFNSST